MGSTVTAPVLRARMSHDAARVLLLHVARRRSPLRTVSMHDFDLYETCMGLWGLTGPGTRTKYGLCVVRALVALGHGCV
jgi:hypothetical protein